MSCMQSPLQKHLQRRLDGTSNSSSPIDSILAGDRTSPQSAASLSNPMLQQQQQLQTQTYMNGYMLGAGANANGGGPGLPSLFPSADGLQLQQQQQQLQQLQTQQPFARFVEPARQAPFARVPAAGVGVGLRGGMEQQQQQQQGQPLCRVPEGQALVGANGLEMSDMMQGHLGAHSQGPPDRRAVLHVQPYLVQDRSNKPVNSLDSGCGCSVGSNSGSTGALGLFAADKFPVCILVHVN